MDNLLRRLPKFVINLSRDDRTRYFLLSRESDQARSAFISIITLLRGYGAALLTPLAQPSNFEARARLRSLPSKKEEEDEEEEEKKREEKKIQSSFQPLKARGGVE